MSQVVPFKKDCMLFLNAHRLKVECSPTTTWNAIHMPTALTCHNKFNISFVLKQKTCLSHKRNNAHLCLAWWWQSQHSGLGHWQRALMVVHTVGHVCPSQITKAVRHSVTHPGKPTAEGNIRENKRELSERHFLQHNNSPRVALPRCLYHSACTWLQGRPDPPQTAWVVNRVLHYKSSAVQSIVTLQHITNTSLIFTNHQSGPLVSSLNLMGANADLMTTPQNK